MILSRKQDKIKFYVKNIINEAKGIEYKKEKEVDVAGDTSLDEQKWEEHLRSGKTFAEILYKNDKNMLDSIDVAEIKKNRVTVAAFTNMANSNPRSPRFNNYYTR